MNYKKQLVYLRQRKRKGGIVFFLDYIKSDGSRVHETLGAAFFLTANNKQHHKELRLTAEAKRQRKEMEILQGDHDVPVKPRDILLSPLVRKAGTTRPNNTNNFNAAADHLDQFQPGLTIQKTTAETLEKFRQFLREKSKKNSEKKLSENTIITYLGNIITTINDAVKQKEIYKNPAAGFKKGKHKANREHLTQAEIQQLLRTPVKYQYIKNWFLFQYFTGLRHGDIKKLTYENIKGEYLVMIQSKTKTALQIPLSEVLKELIGLHEGIIPINKKEPLFKMPSNEFLNRKLKEWATAAGINKTLTTHVIRHSFASNLIENGTALTNVSAMLGHKDITTTAIYLHSNRHEVERAQKLLIEGLKL